LFRSTLTTKEFVNKVNRRDENSGDLLFALDYLGPEAAERVSMATSETRSSHGREEVFGYLCRRCLKCCHHKNIQLNPYEVARLARNRGLTTDEFRAAFTDQRAGLALRQTQSGACMFLGKEGCTVHPDRPLVCRLYPLGRHVRADENEAFFHLQPHPHSHGTFTRSGTIGEFLTSQDAHPFIEASDDYFRWLCAARRYVHKAGDSEHFTAADTQAAVEFLDIDTMIARHCAAPEIAEPIDADARRALHLRLLYQQLHDEGRSVAMSVLVAAICLLGISLGVSGTPLGEPAGPAANSPADQNSI
jgi:Fe-S-cluster containining protein